MNLRRRRAPRSYRLGTDDSITLHVHGPVLRRLGLSRKVTFHLARIDRAAKGARKDRDSAIVVVHRH